MIRTEMMERMTTAEFYEWMVYEQIEPFGDRRADVQAGIVASTYANVHRGSQTEPFKPTDFMLPWEPVAEPEPQTPEQQLEMMLLFQKIQNASVGHA